MKLSRLSNRQLRRLLAQGDVRFGVFDNDKAKRLKKILYAMEKIDFDLRTIVQMNKDLVELEKLGFKAPWTDDLRVLYMHGLYVPKIIEKIKPLLKQEIARNE